MNNSAAGRGGTHTRLGSQLRELADRVRSVERRRTNVVGDWTLVEDDHGNLVAAHISGARVVLASAIGGGSDG